MAVLTSGPDLPSAAISSLGGRTHPQFGECDAVLPIYPLNPPPPRMEAAWDTLLIFITSSITESKGHGASLTTSFYKSGICTWQIEFEIVFTYDKLLFQKKFSHPLMQFSYFILYVAIVWPGKLCTFICKSSLNHKVSVYRPIFHRRIQIQGNPKL